MSPSKAAATNYYVNCNTGSDSNNGQSTGAPLLTLQRFSEVGGNQINLAAGDTLSLARGCSFTGYNVDFDWNGTAESPIIIGAYGTGAQPKVWLQGSQSGTTISVTGSYITIQDLEITADQSTLPHTFVKCPDLAHGFFNGIKINPPSHHITVQNNTITQHARGVNVSIDEGNVSTVPHHLTIINNNISFNTAAADDIVPQNSLNGAKAVDLKGNDSIVAYNYMEGNAVNCPPESGMNESNAIELYDAKRNFIHHNVSVNQRVFSEIGGKTDDLNFNSEDNVFAYNLSYTNQAGSRFIVIHGKNINFGPTLNTQIYNNTFYSSNEDDSQAITCSGCGPDVLVMRNNIIWARDKALFVGPAGAQPIETNNIFWDGDGAPFPSNFTQNWTIDATSQRVDPLFVDAANGNFRLQSSSPAINAGVNSETLDFDFNTEDLDGISLPQNSTLDIGAYENAVSAPAFNGTTYAADTFTRSVASNWGTAETGGTWTSTTTASTGSSNSVNGTQGIAVVGSCGATNTDRLDSLNVLNSDTTFKVKTNKFANGEDQNIYITSRKQSTANWEYRHRVAFNGTAVKLMAGKLQGTSTLVGISANTTITRETFAADTFFWVRTQTYGTSPTTIRMKIWRDGTSEPAGWDITTTDSESMLQNSGAAGLRAFLPGTCTTAPLTITHDDLTIRSMSSPTISLTAQYQSNCSTTLGIGGAANGTEVCLGSTVNDPDNPDTITLQAEVQPLNTAFSNTANYTSAPIVASGTAVNPTISIPDLSEGVSYHWQARAIDSLGNTSAWVPFGNNTETSADFSAQTIPTVQFSPTSSSGAESTTSVNLPVTLSESTTQDVTVNYAVTGGTATGSGTDFTLASGTATVTAGQTTTNIPVTIVNDQIDEDDETIVVTLSNPTNGTLGSNIIYTYTITDNDTAGASITPSSAINVTEGGATASYTIRLNTKPTSDVTVTFSPDSQITTSVPSLTFTTTDFATNKSVTITAVNDASVEGNHNGIISHVFTSADPKYNGLSIPTKTARITDNDSAGVSVTESSGSTSVTEGGATDTYTVALTTQPSSDVTITISPDSQVNVDDTSLTFTNSNWDTPQSITVSAANDSVDEGAHTGVITHSAASSDGNYNGITISSLTAQVTDNDTAGVTVTQSSGTTVVTEGGATDSYTVVLTSQPSNDVTITITDDAEISLNTNSLTFTNSNWSSAQTVTVTAANDDIDEDDGEVSTITHVASSVDSNYNSIAVGSVAATITDNDTAGVTVTQSSGTTAVTEGGATDSFTIVLTSEPTFNVSIDMSSAQVTALTGDEPEPGEEPNLSPAVSFTAENWDTPQTVTVTAVDDGVAEGEHSSPISFNVNSVDSKYSEVTVSDVSVTVTDNDTAGVTVTQSGGTTAVTEGGATDSYTIELQSVPASDVTINISPATGLQTSAATLTFTSANWDTPQTVTVTATNDSNYLGNRSINITHTAASSDGEYDGISVGTVSVDVTEDEVPGVTITESSGTTNVTEGGATDSYTVVLDNAPSANVTVNIAGTNGQVTLSDSSLDFTTSDWDDPQTVTVTAVNDSIAESNHTATLTHTSTSSDGAFNGLTIGSVTANITDNDTAGVTIVQSSDTTAVAEEGETSDSYTLVLTSQPTAGVTINLAGNDDVDLDKTSVSFTTGNWSTPQTVTVTANDDSVARGLYSNVITHTATSSDGTYNGISIASVTVTVTDNDSSGITVTETSGSTTISESGTTDTFTVVLDTIPSSDVVITMASAQASAVKQGTSSNTLTFTTSNWSTPQTVVVSAVNDSVAEGTHGGSISFGVTSTDLSYNDFDIPNISLTITDNDTAGVSISQSGGSTAVSEGGATDSYTLVLQSQPANSVTISLDPESGISVSPTNLTFTTANWDDPQTVTVTGINNSLIDGSRDVDISHEAVSDDGFYDGISISDVTVTVSDDEISELTITQSGGSTVVQEDGGSDSYTVVLSSRPANNVVVTVNNSSSQIIISVNELTFTADNWNTPQIVAVTGVDDSERQGTRTATITHTTESADSNFDNLTGSNVTVSILDNDPPFTSNGSSDSGSSSGDNSSGVVSTVTSVVTAPIRSVARLFSGDDESENEDENVSPVVFIEINIDLDDDGDFDEQDLEVIKNNWFKNLVGRSNGDLNDDGKVDLSDISLFARNW